MSRNIDNDDSDDASDEDEEPFELMDKNELIAMKKDYQSRNSVSAEAFGKFNKKVLIPSLYDDRVISNLNS